MSRAARHIATAIAVVSLGSCVQEVGGETIAGRSEALVTDCDYLNPAIHPPLATPVVFEKELVITHLSVVEDPCRTTWFPTIACSSSTTGVWTFGALMRNMAGTVPWAQFVNEWVHTFEEKVDVNTFTLMPRPDIRPLIIDPWLVASGCPSGAPLTGPGACLLDPKRAPFRLLAIVNRIDLSGPVPSPENGEARFVFGWLDRPVVPGGPPPSPLQATVIFEFGLPTSADAFTWERRWHGLSGTALPSSSFNAQLQRITDITTNPGAEPGALNLGSAINQVRTNEIDFDPGAGWQLREFTLEDVGGGPAACLLTNTTVKQTPDATTNGSVDLDSWMVANEPDIANVIHVVPLTFPSGNAALGGASPSPFLWEDTTGTIAPMSRHLFGFATCGGCHFGETNTRFLHVEPRAAGSTSLLSEFLAIPTTPGPGGTPLFFQGFVDPAGTGMGLRYNEPWRRMCEATRLLHGDPIPFTKANGAH
jgi:hypothetical protein